MTLQAEIRELKKQLALTEKALELACDRAGDTGCPEDDREAICISKTIECPDCWHQYFIEKAKEQ